jgi:hypothetical protein
MSIFYAYFGLVKLEEAQEFLDADGDNSGVSRNLICEHAKVDIELDEFFIAEFSNDISNVLFFSHGISPMRL